MFLQGNENGAQNVIDQVEGKNEELDESSISDLQTKYSTIVRDSDFFAEKDKKSMKTEGLDKDSLKKMIAHIESGEAKDSVERQVKGFEDQIDVAIDKRLFSKESKKAYLKWFREDVSFMEKSDYVKNKSTDLHDPKRQDVLDQWDGKSEVKGVGVYIPEAIRKENEKEFLGKDLQERQKFLTNIAKKHKALRDEFHLLPEELQKKYADSFKKSGIKGREKLLQSSINPELKKLKGQEGPQTKEHSENAESRVLTQQYTVKMGQMKKDKLLSESSLAKYKTWFEKLPLKGKQKMLNNSELDTRMADRVRTRDEFYKIPQKDRAQHEAAFLSMDLDERDDFLKTLNGEETTKNKPHEYPRSHIQNVIKDIINDPAMHERRVIYTILRTHIEQRKRAELNLNARRVEDLARKAGDRGLQGPEERTELARTRLIHQKDEDKQEKVSAFDQYQSIRKKRDKAREATGLKTVPQESGKGAEAPQPKEAKKPSFMDRLLGRSKASAESKERIREPQVQHIEQQEPPVQKQETDEAQASQQPQQTEQRHESIGIIQQTQEHTERTGAQAPQQVEQDNEVESSEISSQQSIENEDAVIPQETLDQPDEPQFKQLRIRDLEAHHDVVHAEKRAIVESNTTLANRYALDTTTIFMSEDNQREMHDAHQAEQELLKPKIAALQKDTLERGLARLPGIKEETLQKEIANMEDAYLLDLTKAGT